MSKERESGSEKLHVCSQKERISSISNFFTNQVDEAFPGEVINVTTNQNLNHKTKVTKKLKAEYKSPSDTQSLDVSLSELYADIPNDEDQGNR